MNKLETSLALIVGDTEGKLSVLILSQPTEAVKVARKLHRKLNGKTAMRKSAWNYTRVLVVPTLEIQ